MVLNAEGRLLVVYGELQALIADKVGIGKGQTILDAGTGPGASLAIRLADIVGKNGMVVAVDYSRSYVGAIKKAIIKSGFKSRISFLLSDLRYMPLKDGSLDAVVSFDAVQDMHDVETEAQSVTRSFLMESARVVKLGRRVVVGTRYPVPRNSAQEAYLKLRLFERELEYMLWRERARYYLDSELALLFQEAGLQQIRTEVIEHSIPYPNDWQKYNISRIRNRLTKVQPHTEKARLKKEFHSLLKEIEKYGEEFPPTLIVVGART